MTTLTTSDLTEPAAPVPAAEQIYEEAPEGPTRPQATLAVSNVFHAIRRACAFGAMGADPEPHFAEIEQLIAGARAAIADGEAKPGEPDRIADEHHDPEKQREAGERELRERNARARRDGRDRKERGGRDRAE